MSETVKTRAYNSPRRQAQAAATRREILVSAKALFEQDGYASTTMPSVATQAGVALKTVYTSFETKSRLLHAVWDYSLAGDDAQVPVAARDWYLEVLHEPDVEKQLRLNAHNSRRGKERLGRVLDVIRGGAQVDGEVAALWQTIQSEYHDNQRVIVESIDQKRALKRSLDVVIATDLLWTLNHPNTWQLLVDERGWSADRFEKYVAENSRLQLLR